MKTTLKILIPALCMGGLIVLFSCDKDDDPVNNNDICNIELCIGNETLKQICLDEYDDCKALGEKTDGECLIFAEETCTI